MLLCLCPRKESVQVFTTLHAKFQADFPTSIEKKKESNTIEARQAAGRNSRLRNQSLVATEAFFPRR